MEPQKTTPNTAESSGDGVIAGIVIGGVLCLAIIGLHKLLTQDNGGRKSIAGRRESELIKEMLDEE